MLLLFMILVHSPRLATNVQPGILPWEKEISTGNRK